MKTNSDLVLEAFEKYKEIHKEQDSFSEREFLIEADLYSFPQTWGSTALGFGGFGGQMITKAQTTVILVEFPYRFATVFFGGEFAYSVDNFSNSFFEDLVQFKMASVTNKTK